MNGKEHGTMENLTHLLPAGPMRTFGKLTPIKEEPEVSPTDSTESSSDEIHATKEPEVITNGTENHCSAINNESALQSIDLLDSKENIEIKEVLNKDNNDCQDIDCKDNNDCKDKEVCSEDIIVIDVINSNIQISNEQCSEESLLQKTKKANHANSKDTKQDDTVADAVIQKINNSDKKLKHSSSPDIQILSDNEDNVIEVKNNPKVIKEDKPQLRRSSRVIKRKRYDNMENKDYESDIDEIPVPEVKRKYKPTITKYRRPSFDMALKQIKSDMYIKENTVDFRDTNQTYCDRLPIMRKNPMAINKVSLTAHNLCQSILARGTTVTPVSSKTQAPTGSNCITQPNILPSLTDDMFVVEAPSFIVPYVYEKPSVKPFREFVDELGKELAELKGKEDDLKKTENETEKAEEETHDMETSGEDKNQDSEEKCKENAATKKKKTTGKRKHTFEDDDLSWDGSTSDSEDLDSSYCVLIKSQASDEIKDVPGITAEPKIEGKSNKLTDMPLGKFFTEIGLHLVQEHVQNDLLKQQCRKLNIEKKRGHSTGATEASIAALTKNIEISKENNAPYRFKMQKCKFCSFKSESSLALQHHLETPHMKDNVYKCNFCQYNSKSPHDILSHLEAEHNIQGRLERAPSYHQCANCPFEDNGKGKLVRHLTSCAKKFKPEFNLSPPIDWESPAKIPKIARTNNQLLGTYQNMFNKGQNIANSFGRPAMNHFVPSCAPRPRVRSPMNMPPRMSPAQGIPIVRGTMFGRNNPTQVQMFPNFSGTYDKNVAVPKTMYQPSISITPLTRQPNPLQQAPTPPPGQHNKSSCVICEICDGYIKDLEQLRSHMQWIHKVKIHPKMIHNRPPLNCQKCQFRFFTDQGLERHLLGSHGLVTSSMQEAANKGKDAGRCPVCGRVYQWRLLNHVTKEHKLMLKPAHLSYKCTVCTATFGMYKQFESHVYSEHSVVPKHGPAEKDRTTATPVKAGQSLLKPFKIKEVTVTPQSTKSSDKSVEKGAEKKFEKIGEKNVQNISTKNSDDE